MTNGVHLPTWLGPELGQLLRERLGAGFEYQVLNGRFAEAVQSVPDDELWQAHRDQKRRLIEFLRTADAAPTRTAWAPARANCAG